jgi:hypothetical protein
MHSQSGSNLKSSSKSAFQQSSNINQCKNHIINPFYRLRIIPSADRVVNQKDTRGREIIGGS